MRRRHNDLVYLLFSFIFVFSLWTTIQFGDFLHSQSDKNFVVCRNGYWYKTSDGYKCSSTGQTLNCARLSSTNKTCYLSLSGGERDQERLTPALGSSASLRSSMRDAKI